MTPEESLKHAPITYMRQSDMLKCPFAIMMLEHYNGDGTCKCTDKTHRDTVMIPQWGYTEQDFIDAGITQQTN